MTSAQGLEKMRPWTELLPSDYPEYFRNHLHPDVVLRLPDPGAMLEAGEIGAQFGEYPESLREATLRLYDRIAADRVERIRARPDAGSFPPDVQKIRSFGAALRSLHTARCRREQGARLLFDHFNDLRRRLAERGDLAKVFDALQAHGNAGEQIALLRVLDHARRSPESLARELRSADLFAKVAPDYRALCLLAVRYESWADEQLISRINSGARASLGPLPPFAAIAFEEQGRPIRAQLLSQAAGGPSDETPTSLADLDLDLAIAPAPPREPEPPPQRVTRSLLATRDTRALARDIDAGVVIVLLDRTRRPVAILSPPLAEAPGAQCSLSEFREKRGTWVRQASRGRGVRITRGRRAFADLLPYATENSEGVSVAEPPTPAAKGDRGAKLELVEHLTVDEVRRAVRLLEGINQVDAELRHLEVTNSRMQKRASARILWEGRVIERTPKLDRDGFLTVDGVRYGSFAACGKVLGLSAMKVKESWRETVPEADPEGFLYVGEDEERQTYLLWKMGRRTLETFYPLDVMRRICGR